MRHSESQKVIVGTIQPEQEPTGSSSRYLPSIRGGYQDDLRQNSSSVLNSSKDDHLEQLRYFAALR